ncbi:MAG: hypothetical protein ABI920_02205 [Casimicrobiaceae bacterium]
MKLSTNRKARNLVGKNVSRVEGEHAADAAGAAGGPAVGRPQRTQVKKP